MPTASAYNVAKTLLYKSPVGSCNVAETTKVRSRAMNVPIVAHAMEKVDCAPATRDTLENRVRPKPSWSKEGHSFIA